MKRGSAVQLFLVGVAIVGAVAAVTFGIVQALDLGDDDGVAATDDGTVTAGPGTTAPAVEEIPLLADQVQVTGTATGITVEGATLPIATPFTVATGTAELTDVEVDGQVTNVVWDGGRPFDLQGVGGIEPPGLNLYAAPTAITAGFIDGVVNTFVAGSYALQTPVAIGAGGLGEAREGVGFAATADSGVVFRRGATTSFLPRELSLEAGGHVLLQGTFEVRQPGGVTVSATAVELPDGAFRLHANPRPDAAGYDVDVLLQGAVAVT